MKLHLCRGRWGSHTHHTLNTFAFVNNRGTHKLTK